MTQSLDLFEFLVFSKFYINKSNLKAITEEHELWDLSLPRDFHRHVTGCGRFLQGRPGLASLRTPSFLPFHSVQPVTSSLSAPASTHSTFHSTYAWASPENFYG